MLWVVVLILIVSYKLVPAWHPRVTGHFISSLEGRNPEETRPYGSRAFLPQGDAVPLRTALPEYAHQSLWAEKSREKWTVAGSSFPRLKMAHFQGKFKLSQRPLISETQLSGTELRNKTHAEMVSEQPK